MSEYIAFWWHYADFKGKTTRSSFWIAFLVWCAIPVVLAIPSGVIGMFVLHMSPEEATDFVRAILLAYSAVSFVPLLAATARRLRDAGYSAKSFFWLLVPGIGGIAFFVRLCSKSQK